uniref:Ig-like domain-containing protein n=1 Tax=Pygocentrus nattereri TaxID=42514 RepID=A0AAR2IL79_PYGNA
MRSSFVFFLYLLRGACSGSDGDPESLNLCIHIAVSRGFNLPEFLQRTTLNDVTIFYHDSTMASKMPCPDWLNSIAGQWHWKHIQNWADRNRRVITQGFTSAVQQFNRTGLLADSNIYEGWGCCTLFPNGTYRSWLTHKFNGKDFISLDLNKRVFVAAVSEAVLYKNQRCRDERDMDDITDYYRKVIIDRLNIFKNAPSVRIRKVPEVRIFEKQKAGSITVTCHVTGFYPRAVQVDWLGPDLHPVDGGVTDVLPNEDGTYQTRRSVTVPEEDVGKHTYSCVVLHSSVEHNITTVWVVEKRSRFAVWSLACICLLIIGFGFWSCFSVMIRRIKNKKLLETHTS